jgi:hypothetical protein
MYRLQIRQLIIIRIDAGAKEQPRISSVHNLGHVSKLDEVGLVLLVSRGNEAVDLHVGWLIMIFDYYSMPCGGMVAHSKAFEAAFWVFGRGRMGGGVLHDGGSGKGCVEAGCGRTSPFSLTFSSSWELISM